MIMIRELNEYFERFEREKESKNLQPEDTYVCKIPVRLFELIKSSLRPGQPELDVIASKLDEKYDIAPEIPGFSHNEQKNREELDKLADQLKTTCAELKYIQTKDVKRHVVEYLAKKKRKRKTNSRKDKSKLGSEPKRPCYNSREVQPKSESLKSCQSKQGRLGRLGAQRVAQSMITTEESQALNHQNSLLLMNPPVRPSTHIPTDIHQNSYMSQVAGTNTGMDLEVENLSRFPYSFRGLEEALQQQNENVNNVDNNAGAGGGIPPMMPSLMKQSPSAATMQDYQQMQMSAAMRASPATDEGLQPLNQQYASNQAEEAFNNGMDYMSLMSAGSSTFRGMCADSKYMDNEMPLVTTSMQPMGGYQMVTSGGMWPMEGPC
eukprot:TCONS_00056784-protein